MKFYSMLQNARVTAFTFSELLREIQLVCVCVCVCVRGNNEPPPLSLQPTPRFGMK